jgi:hypothetical protein
MHQSADKPPIWLYISDPDAVTKRCPHKVVKRNCLIGQRDCDQINIAFQTAVDRYRVTIEASNFAHRGQDGIKD